MAYNTTVKTFISATATTAAGAITAFNTAVTTLIGNNAGPIDGIKGLLFQEPRIIVGSDAQSGDYEYTASSFIQYNTLA